MTEPTLADLGWSPHFARQLEPDEPGQPARVSAIHRDRLDALSVSGLLTLRSDLIMSDYAVGDWIMQDGAQVLRRLEPLGEIRRRAAGSVERRQLIASNVDVLGIVTSCNADFNPSRIERYLAIAAAAGSFPLILLTKADKADDPDSYRKEAEKLSPLAAVLTLNARDSEDVARLSPWCTVGKTLALVGSSGVGKTTLLNQLTGGDSATAGIRESDGRGRHTTTSRTLHPILTGGWLIDTPGMRELGMSDAAEGLDEVFEDLSDLAGQCRFNDCKHESEPGCAIQAALASGSVDADRLGRWQQLHIEDQFNSLSAADARARQRGKQKIYNSGKRRGKDKRETGG